MRKKSLLKLLMGIIFSISLSSCGFIADKQMQDIENKVAEDAVKQYEIAKSGGNATDIYVQAGMVAAAYLQAKDEVNYKKWKQIETDAAKAAGVSE